MKALLSPHSSTALVFQPKPMLLGSEHTLHTLSLAEITEWLISHEELREFTAENMDQLWRELSLHSQQQEALDLALICLDNDLSITLRDEAQQQLEILLANPDIAAWLTDLFHLRPLPDSADVTIALNQANKKQRIRLITLLNNIIHRKEIIIQLWNNWSTIPDKLLKNAGGRQAVLDLALRNRLFSKIAELLIDEKYNDAKFEALLRLRGVSNQRQIVNMLLNKFITIDNSNRKKTLIDDPEEWNEVVKNTERKHHSFDRNKTLRRVEEQKARIVHLMQSGQWKRIPTEVNGLIDYQHRHGGGKYAAKSLCDLANEAKALGEYKLQLNLTEQAIKQNLEDGWALAQYGDALLNNGRLQEAFTAYENSSVFGAYIVGQIGRAEVLKALGRHSEALTAYDTIIADHPENVVAKNGRAEVFKVMGKLHEAAAAYANTRNQHSEDLITRNGYASVLSMLGEYQSALELLPSTEPEYLQDWIGWHIRGIALLRSGKVAEALSTLELGAYKTVSIQRDYFRTALAMARLWQQDWKRAKEQLNRITNTTPIIEQASNIIWLHIHAVDNNQDGVEQSFINLAKNKSSIQLIELTEELRLRYLEKKKGQHNNQWLREREIDILLAA